MKNPLPNSQKRPAFWPTRSSDEAYKQLCSMNDQVIWGGAPSQEVLRGWPDEVIFPKPSQTARYTIADKVINLKRNK